LQDTLIHERTNPAEVTNSVN